MSKSGDGDTNRPGATMSVLELHEVDWAREMLVEIEDDAARRKGVSVEEIRPLVGERLGTGSAILRSVRQRRRKTVPHGVLEAIRQGLIDVLQSQVTALHHRIAILDQIGGRPDRDDLLAAKAHLAEVEKILGGAS